MTLKSSPESLQLEPEPNFHTTLREIVGNSQYPQPWASAKTAVQASHTDVSRHRDEHLGATQLLCSAYLLPSSLVSFKSVYR